MQAIDTNPIKIGQFVWKLWRFKDKLSKLEWELKGNEMEWDEMEWNEIGMK